MRLMSIFVIRARACVFRCSIVGLGVMAPVMARAQQSCQAEGRLMPVKGLPEASGVAVSRKSPDVLWSHNDSGEPVLVAVGTDGETRGRYGSPAPPSRIGRTSMLARAPADPAFTSAISEITTAGVGR
jgi:hypothetical protein